MRGQETLAFSSGDGRLVQLQQQSQGIYSGAITGLDTGAQPVEITAFNPSAGQLSIQFFKDGAQLGTADYFRLTQTRTTPLGVEVSTSWSTTSETAGLPGTLGAVILGKPDATLSSRVLQDWNWDPTKLLSVNDVISAGGGDRINSIVSSYASNQGNAYIPIVANKEGAAWFDALNTSEDGGPPSFTQTLDAQLRIVYAPQERVATFLASVEAADAGAKFASQTSANEPVITFLIPNQRFQVSIPDVAFARKLVEDTRLHSCAVIAQDWGYSLQCDFHSTEAGLVDQWWIRGLADIAPVSSDRPQLIVANRAIRARGFVDAYDAAARELDRVSPKNGGDEEVPASVKGALPALLYSNYLRLKQ